MQTLTAAPSSWDVPMGCDGPNFCDVPQLAVEALGAGRERRSENAFKGTGFARRTGGRPLTEFIQKRRPSGRKKKRTFEVMIDLGAKLGACRRCALGHPGPAQPPYQGMIDVMILPHSHQDAGFIVTYSHVRDKLCDRTYETIFECLRDDPRRHFNVAEVNFFRYLKRVLGVLINTLIRTPCTLNRRDLCTYIL